MIWRLLSVSHRSSRRDRASLHFAARPDLKTCWYRSIYAHPGEYCRPARARSAEWRRRWCELRSLSRLLRGWPIGCSEGRRDTHTSPGEIVLHKCRLFASSQVCIASVNAPGQHVGGQNLSGPLFFTRDQHVFVSRAPVRLLNMRGSHVVPMHLWRRRVLFRLLPTGRSCHTTPHPPLSLTSQRPLSSARPTSGSAHTTRSTHAVFVSRTSRGRRRFSFSNSAASEVSTV